MAATLPNFSNSNSNASASSAPPPSAGSASSSSALLAIAPGLSSPPCLDGLVGTPTASKDSKWLMTPDQIQNSPSRRDGLTSEHELNNRQKAAYLIQDMGQRLRVSQLCINTAIVYMHRFYMFHSFNIFHRNGIAAASLFLAAA